MFTIAGLILHPYQIDVEDKNFVVVEITVSKGGKVAGKETEAGKERRNVEGYYNTLGACINYIMKKKSKSFHSEFEGQRITLKQYLERMDAYRKEFIAFAKHISFELPEDTLPIKSPRQLLEELGKETEDEE